jgi:Kazal-type serine protease inhibitor domain
MMFAQKRLQPCASAPIISFVLVVALHAQASETQSPIPVQASPPEVCTQIYQPVCGTDATGNRVTYPNACFARIARATNVTEGECAK